MPIRHYLQGHRFDPARSSHGRRLRDGSCSPPARRRGGSPDPRRSRPKDHRASESRGARPERLCDEALKATQPMAPVLVSDPTPLSPPASRPAPPDFAPSANQAIGLIGSGSTAAWTRCLPGPSGIAPAVSVPDARPVGAANPDIRRGPDVQGFAHDLHGRVHKHSSGDRGHSSSVRGLTSFFC